MDKFIIKLSIILFLFLGFSSALQAKDKQLYLSISSPLATLDPQLIHSTWEHDIVLNLFEGLVANDDKGGVRSAVASSYTLSPDGKMYTFHLREGLKWSDGVPLTADDVIFSFQRIVDPKIASKSVQIISDIKNVSEIQQGKKNISELGVKKVDDKTITIELNNPVSYFLSNLTHSVAMIVPKHNVEKYPSDWLKPEHFVGNGAYVMTKRIINVGVEAKKNPYYYEADKVKIKEVFFSTISEVDSTYKMFKAGKADTTYFTYENLPEVKRIYPDALRVKGSLNMWYLSFNVKKNVKTTPEVRKAAYLLVDRNYIIDKLHHGIGTPAYSMFPYDISNYYSKEQRPLFDDVENQTMKERIKKAQEIMSKAGYSTKNPLVLDFVTFKSEQGKQLSVALRSMLKKGYILLKPINVEAKTLYQRVEDYDYDISMPGWFADYDDPLTFMSVFSDVQKGNNFPGYQNAEFDELYRKIAFEVNAEKRKQFIKQAEANLMKNLPMIPIYIGSTKVLVNPKLDGWVDNKLQRHPVRYLSWKK